MAHYREEQILILPLKLLLLLLLVTVMMNSMVSCSRQVHTVVHIGDGCTNFSSAPPSSTPSSSSSSSSSSPASASSSSSDSSSPCEQVVSRLLPPPPPFPTTTTITASDSAAADDDPDHAPPSARGLSTSFYEASCPQMASIAASTFQSLAASDNVVAPSVLRLILHDAFVQGCDASILVSPVPGSPAVERQHPDNVDIPQQAFDAVSAIKRQLEAACPGVVSCADILALSAQLAVAFLQGPAWEVPFGRRDARASLASAVDGNLPTPDMDVDAMLAIFEAKSLTLHDLVTLSGAHTIGFAKCSQFAERLAPAVDPTMDPSFARELAQACNASQMKPVPLDPASPFLFDASYYTTLEDRRGLLFSDQVLAVDNRTRELVAKYASSPPDFFANFVDAMVRMSGIGVLTGDLGEIRTDCTAINPG